MAWSTPTSQSLGSTYTTTQTLNGVDFTITVQTNSKRANYASISASATTSDAKTANATSNAINALITALQTLVDDNAGTGSGKAF